MSTNDKTTIVLELTEREAQCVIDAVQDHVEQDELGDGNFTSEEYRTAANAVVDALNAVGLSGDNL